MVEILYFKVFAIFKSSFNDFFMYKMMDIILVVYSIASVHYQVVVIPIMIT